MFQLLFLLMLNLALVELSHMYGAIDVNCLYADALCRSRLSTTSVFYNRTPFPMS